jgi:uncharacterized phage-associated protein
MLPVSANYEKAIAAMLYIANRLERRDIHRVFKLLYFADKLHLQRYGRLIAGDEYHAFSQGPLPTHLYDYVRVARNEPAYNNDLDDEGIRLFFEAFDVKGYNLNPKQDPDLDELSPSDRKVLDEIIATFGKLPKDALSDLSHDEAWKRGRRAYRFRMDLETIVSALDNHEEVRVHLEQRAML